MGLPDLAGLAEEIFHRTRPPASGTTSDEERVFDDRNLRVGITFGGAGHTEGDLTPGCAHALTTVLDALAKKAGPEDARTATQRRHDALEEACRRLIAAGMVPGRAAQPTQLTVHMTLAQLRGLPGAGDAERAWIAAHATTQPGWLSGPEADAAACDATITPVVTGRLDPAALDQLTRLFGASYHPQATGADSSRPAATSSAGGTPDPVPATCHPPPAARAAPPAATAARDRLRRALLGLAIATLSGPGGLAAHLRATLTDPAAGGRDGSAAGLASRSLPLDVGAATPTIPAHLRKAAALRHRHCAFPGCRQPASVCDIHHLIPRARGGPTSLPNLVPLCQFHHLTAIHRWGWTLQLHPDGTTTATSPDRSRTFHSHSPPGGRAA
jgi:hypothetical protein